MSLFSKTYSVGHFQFGGHEFELSNWFRILPPQSEMTFSIDGEVKSRTRKLTHANPKAPVFRISDFSSQIKSIEVFVIGVTRIKFSVKINGEVAYRDHITTTDRLQGKYMGRERCH